MNSGCSDVCSCSLVCVCSGVGVVCGSGFGVVLGVGVGVGVEEGAGSVFGVVLEDDDDEEDEEDDGLWLPMAPWTVMVAVAEAVFPAGSCTVTLAVKVPAHE